jgi:hypothetical protein
LNSTVSKADRSAKTRQWLTFFGLFGSLSTLLCCALPALLVTLGLGGALAGLVGAFPQIVWVSEHKLAVFGITGLLILLGGWLQWRARYEPCPRDPVEAAACQTARRVSAIIYAVSLALYLVGSYFAFAF